MDQQQTENATNAARGWLYAEICDVSESTCEIERHFYATFRLGRGIQRDCRTINTTLIDAMCRGGCDLSIVPPVVLVGRVAAEK